MNQNRVPEGVPTGGQFATSQRASDDVVELTTAVDERCECGKSLSDGEGYDGKCGDCADRDYAQNVKDCAECGYEMSANDPASICVDCEMAGEAKDRLPEGTRVYWTDPAAEPGNDASGYYTVAEDDGNSIQLRDDHGDISNEAFANELTVGELITDGDKWSVVGLPPSEMVEIPGMGDVPVNRSEVLARIEIPDVDGDEGHSKLHLAELEAREALPHMPEHRFDERWNDMRKATAEEGHNSHAASEARYRAVMEEQAWADARGATMYDQSYQPPANKSGLLRGRFPGNATKVQIGEKYTERREITAVAKDVRTEIATAAEAGYLPSNLKYRVVSERFAGGQALRVEVRGLTDDQTVMNGAIELRRRLDALANVYNRSEMEMSTDRQRTDYFVNVALTPRTYSA